MYISLKIIQHSGEIVHEGRIKRGKPAQSKKEKKDWIQYGKIPGGQKMAGIVTALLSGALMSVPAALQLADCSERRYGGVQKAFAAAGKSPLLREEISALTTWLSL